MSGSKESAQTKLRIKEAFLDYCIEHNSLPNVKHLCIGLGIDRGTFYNHFNSIKDLAESLMLELFDKNERFRSDLRIVSFEMIYNLSQVCIQDRRTVLVLLNPAFMLPFRTEIRNLICSVTSELITSGTDAERKYKTAFIADGILSITYSWLKDQDMGYEEFIQMMFKLVFRAMQ